MHPLHRLVSIGTAALVCVTAFSAHAKPLSETDVPAPLKAWIPWAMHDTERSDCPFIHTAQDQRVCMWPTSLALDLGKASGSFSFVVTVYNNTPDGTPQRVTLPGQTDVWPQDVTVNGEPRAVLLFNGAPTLLLSKGEYTIRGGYAWDKMPVAVTLPLQVGIVNLAVNGAPVATPEIVSGQVLLQRAVQAELPTAENQLEVKIFRKFTDSIPQLIETRLQLNVSGKQREEVLGQVLPPGTEPIDIMSDLSARLDNDGKLRVQLRAGTHDVAITSRVPEPTNHFALPAANGDLPAEEIWSVETQNQLRLVQITGAQAIDPAQTELPQEWRSLPAYYLKTGDAIEIQEIKRGASETAPDQLTLQRKLWLDFSGSGYTVQDSIGGTIKNSGRLEVQDGVMLGSATINGQDQYITTIVQDGKVSNPGVEVREGPVSMSTNSRFDGGSEIPATGWKSTFDNAYATLYLPPGWTLLGYSGVDSASYSWINSWSLVDIFLVMITAVAAYRFWGRRMGIIAGAGLVLIHPELKSFTTFLLTAILCLAIQRAVKPGKLQSLMGMISKLVVLIMVLSALPFMMTHMREALYPQLADNNAGWHMPGVFGGAILRRNDAQNVRAEAYMDQEMAPEPASPPPPPMMAEPTTTMAEGAADNAAPVPSEEFKDSRVRYKSKSAFLAQKALAKADVVIQQQYQSYTPDTKVQTGYGNRNISESGITLAWSGSVDPSVSMHLWLISSKMNLLLALIRVCLIALIIAALIGGMLPRVREKMRFVFPLILLALFFSSAPVSDARAQEVAPVVEAGKGAAIFPPQALLDELKKKLSVEINRPESCLPECASLSRTRIKIAGNQLELELEIHAEAEVAVPLPGGISNWRPSLVLVNGVNASALTVNGDDYLTVKLSKGVSRLRLAGPVASNLNTLGITFPMMSRFTTSETSGWDVLGVRENGVTESSLQLNRTERSVVSKTEAGFEKTVLPPFYQVERTISLGNRWEVNTVVRKLTPPDAPSAIEIPLLAGESVTSSDTQVKNGKAYAGFDPGKSEVSFTSVIPQVQTMTLIAPVKSPWVEVWKLSASNLWHVKADGIPRIYESNNATPDTANIIAPGGSGYSIWMPWPGEKLTFTIERPAGVEGATRTIDSTNLRLTPSDRSTDVSLEISLRSSLGGQHDITLPENAVLTDVTRAGLILPTQMKGNVLTLPLVPGSNAFLIRWKEPASLDAIYRPSAVGIGADRSVNATVNVTVPQNRWILFTAGPLMGPAVLFWSWIPVILILSFGLGKITATPLRMRHWFIMLLGLSFSSTAGIVMIIAWVLAFGWRGASEHEALKNYRFNLVQLALVGLTLTVMPILLDCVHDGLLGQPQMNIRGNNSYGNELHWYQDITSDALPRPLIISVPMWLYRVLMLLWALWLAFSMVSWLRWSWDSFTRGGYWRKVWSRKKEAAAKAPEKPVVESGTK